ncbi:MAG: NAD(P)-dependent oxidoreductase [Candidatus Paceibacterota bacterium]
MKITFFEVSKKKEEEYRKIFNNLDLVFCEEKLTKDNISLALDSDIVYVFVNSILNKENIDLLPNLKFVVTGSTGYDHIDVSYCHEKNIPVSTVPAYGSQTVAEFTFALLLNLSRKVYLANNKLRLDGKFSTENFEGFDLEGKTIGVVGTGKIGKNVIRIAKGFNMNVVAYDLYPDAQFATDNNFTYHTLDEVLDVSDILTLHAPYTKENHHMINKENILKMKRGVYLLNTARGELLDTEALMLALKEGIVGGAGLDVLEGERELKNQNDMLVSENDVLNYKMLLEDRSLIDMDNVIVTPHIAFSTKEAEDRIMETVVSNIKGFTEGQLINIVK